MKGDCDDGDDCHGDNDDNGGDDDGGGGDGDGDGDGLVMMRIIIIIMIMMMMRMPSCLYGFGHREEDQKPLGNETVFPKPAKRSSAYGACVFEPFGHLLQRLVELWRALPCHWIHLPGTAPEKPQHFL